MYHPSVIAASLDLTRAGSAGPGAAWGEAGDLAAAMPCGSSWP